MTDVLEIAKKAKKAAIDALMLSSDLKNQALLAISQELESSEKTIIDANKRDLLSAQKLLDNNNLSQSAFNRLKLDENKLRDMIQGVKDTIKLEDPVNKILWSKDIADGMTLKKVSCPIGVIGVIFEARPDVISQIATLAIKSSNAVILKGGTEAAETNKTIFNIISSALDKIDSFPKNMINLIFSREDVNSMLELDEYINLIIPRGSNSLVKYIKANTKIPVLGHSDGICHIYIDESADLKKALDVCIDAKCQYPSACNSVETILINEKTVNRIYKPLVNELLSNGVKIKTDDKLFDLFPNLEMADDADWQTEYGEKIVSVKQVSSVDEAINHINKYGSGHTDCIITEDKKVADKFMTYVDSAGVYQNASTRFADGFRYGFGAEVGISTNKTHARGPVGLEGLTIYKYKLYGNGDIVQDFSSGKRHFNK